jgi:hypothetical protein
MGSSKSSDGDKQFGGTMRFAGFSLLYVHCVPIIGAQNASDIDKIAEEGALTVTDVGADYGSPPTQTLQFQVEARRAKAQANRILPDVADAKAAAEEIRVSCGKVLDPDDLT